MNDQPTAMDPTNAPAAATAAVSAASSAPLPGAWQRYLDDLKSHAGGPVPLEAQGTLVRVAGLVLELSLIHI